MFTKVAKEITIAARQGGGDPEANAKLKLVVQKAKAINMPNENISRAIKKGSGELDGEAYEEFVYEGYAPGGVAVMLDIATDNRNRTASDIRHLFSKHGGNLGESGCVAWMFERSGLITVMKNALKMDEEEFILTAIEAGASDVRDDDDIIEVISLPESFMKVREEIEALVEVENAEVVLLPLNTVDVNDEETAARVLRIIDVLEDHDDVQNVYANFSIPDDLMEKLC